MQVLEKLKEESLLMLVKKQHLIKVQMVMMIYRQKPCGLSERMERGTQTQKQRTMTQEEENQHIKKLKDAGFDCGTSRSMLETIQLLKLSKGETRKI